MQSNIKNIEDALRELQQGKMIILVDDPARENEGDLIFPAENITSDIMSFMIRHSSGIVCLSLTADHLKKLELPLMVPASENTSQRGTPFTISIEAKHGVTTGVSAADRARTIQVAVQENAKPDDLVRPGHVFPLQAKDGGVLERPGHTEGAIDLVRLAGFKPAAVLCEIMNPNGSMTRGLELKTFAEQHQLKIFSIADVISYRLQQESIIEESASASLPINPYGLFKITIFTEKLTGKEHVVLSNQDNKPAEPVLVRIHSACMTGDLFGSQRCDCHQQLHYSLQKISEEGGVLIYLNQEGRGIGLLNKIKAYALQESGFDTVDANHQLGLAADLRKYDIAAHILRNLKINKIRLLTNNPHKLSSLGQYEFLTVERELIPSFENKYNKNYLLTKKNKLNHFINLVKHMGF